MVKRSFSNDQRTIITAQLLTIWKRSNRKLISLDADTFSIYFPFLNVVHSVHDSKTNNIKFVLVNRVEAMKAIANERNLKTDLTKGQHALIR